MEQLTFDELLDYYLGFDREGNEKIWNKSANISLSKSLAYEEITRWVEIYRHENKITEKVQELNLIYAKYLNLLDARGSNYSCVFINTEYGDIKTFIKDLARFLLNNCSLEFIQIIKDLKTIENELILIWSNDPEKIRYESKFSGFYPQQYYSNEIRSGKLIFTKNYTFNFEITAIFGEDYLPSIVSNIRKYDIVFFPILNFEEFNIGLLNDFVIYYNVKKHKRTVLWFLIFDEKRSLKNADFILEHINSFETKLKNLNCFYFDIMKYSKIIKQKDGTWVFEKLLIEMDVFIDYLNYK